MKSNAYTKNYPWILVALLWVVALLNYLDRQMLATMRPAMQIDIAELETATNFGRLMAVFLFVYAFMSPVSGLIADRVNRKWLIVGSLFVWSCVTFSMGFAKTFEQLYALRAIMGVSEALYIPGALALIADFHTNKTRSLANGLHLSGLYLGQALGGFGANVAEKFSWNMTFHSFGLIGILYAIVLVFMLKEVDHEVRISNKGGAGKVPILKGLSVLLGNISFWIILFYFAVPSLSGWGIKNWLPTLYADRLNLDMTKAGPLATLTVALASFVGVIIGGIISDKWALRNIRGRIYTSAIGLSMTIPALVMISFGDSLFLAIGAGVVFGFGFGMFDGNNMPILCQFVSAKYRASAYGLMNLTGILSGAIVTDYLGKSTDRGNLAHDFGLMAGMVLVALVMQLVFLRPKVHNFME